MWTFPQIPQDTWSETQNFCANFEMQPVWWQTGRLQETQKLGFPETDITESAQKVHTEKAKRVNPVLGGIVEMHAPPSKLGWICFGPKPCRKRHAHFFTGEQKCLAFSCGCEEAFKIHWKRSCRKTIRRRGWGCVCTSVFPGDPSRYSPAYLKTRTHSKLQKLLFCVRLLNTENLCRVRFGNAFPKLTQGLGTSRKSTGISKSQCPSSKSHSFWERSPDLRFYIWRPTNTWCSNTHHLRTIQLGWASVDVAWSAPGRGHLESVNGYRFPGVITFGVLTFTHEWTALHSAPSATCSKTSTT